MKLRLPSISTFSSIWQIFSFIMFLVLIIPPLYGLGVVFTTNKLPPFVPQDVFTKLGFGVMYGYYEVFNSIRMTTGLTGGAYVAKDLIIKNNITDVSANFTAYPQYENMSRQWNETFSSFLSPENLTYVNMIYQDYCVSMGIQDNSTWQLNIFLVSGNGQYLIADIYTQHYSNGTFQISLSNDMTGVPTKYGIICTEDIMNQASQIMTNSGSLDYGKIALMVLGTVRNGNIVFFNY